MFGMMPHHLQHNEYFAVARVSPCSETGPAVAAQNHLDALNAHMQQVLDIKIEASKDRVKEGAVKLKKSLQPGVTKNLVLIWNTAAGFSDNFDVLMDCCGTFTHLAYFDCEFDGKVMHQFLRFVQCTNVIDFLKKVRNGNDNLSLNRVSQFRSDRLFTDVCSLESLKRAAGYAEALNFFKAMVISLNDIFHRTMPRSEKHIPQNNASQRKSMV
ncbi:hypothetical protein MP228_004507 [Amoeboaphelidium protococcarum]|nr:hypothetical protein MP228_004507 [Amoeboaphelidium protococcarum]